MNELFDILFHPVLWSIIFIITGILIFITIFSGKGKKILQNFILLWMLIPLISVVAPVFSESKIYIIAKDTTIVLNENFKNIYFGFISNITYDVTLLTPWEKEQEIIMLNFFSTHKFLVKEKISSKAQSSTVFGFSDFQDEGKTYLLGKNVHRTSRFNPKGKFLKLDIYTFGGTTGIFEK